MAIKGGERYKLKYLIWTLVISVVYAVSDEIHQIFVPGRFPSVKDVLIDSIGILLAVLIYPKKRNAKEDKRKIKNKKKD